MDFSSDNIAKLENMATVEVKMLNEPNSATSNTTLVRINIEVIDINWPIKADTAKNKDAFLPLNLNRLNIFLVVPLRLTISIQQFQKQMNKIVTKKHF